MNSWPQISPAACSVYGQTVQNVCTQPQLFLLYHILNGNARAALYKVSGEIVRICGQNVVNVSPK